MENFSWKNIFGNASRIENLKKMLAQKNFPHAVIFSGVEGIGKRKIAETCAAVLLCEKPKDGEACGECLSCRILAAGNHPDFYVVEPEQSKTAPNIKIGQIRTLQDAVALQPERSACRVVIIDGAEFMNTAAANCLLKTLEEPTGQTIFILVTANRAGLLMTVRSRCGTVNFEKISAAEIANALKLRGVDSSRAQIISQISDGSFGRALKLEESGGYELREDALNFLENLLAKKISIEDIFNKGKTFSEGSKEDFADFVNYLQKILRDVFLLEQAELYNPDLKSRLVKIKISEKNLYALFEEGKKIQRKINSNANLRLLAESYFLKLRQSVEV
ncbi:MAG: DNA polymerase III subunit delta' [Selenomonadaceae bacterium]|nr:DNA polymerase III subunit delta' [Selenomonadaceae bacterium]